VPIIRSQTAFRPRRPRRASENPDTRRCEHGVKGISELSRTIPDQELGTSDVMAEVHQEVTLPESSTRRRVPRLATVPPRRLDWADRIVLAALARPTPLPGGCRTSERPEDPGGSHSWGDAEPVTRVIATAGAVSTTWASSTSTTWRRTATSTASPAAWASRAALERLPALR
jgi:hypothetical protein